MNHPKVCNVELQLNCFRDSLKCVCLLSVSVSVSCDRSVQFGQLDHSSTSSMGHGMSMNFFLRIHCVRVLTITPHFPPYVKMKHFSTIALPVFAR